MAQRRDTGITCLRFNQDQAFFVCSLRTGLRIYCSNPLVEKSHYGYEDYGEVLLCEMVMRSNWVLIVLAKQPCVMLILDDEDRDIACEVTFRSPIRGIFARADKVAVALTNSIQIMNMLDMKRIALLRIPQCIRPLCAIATATAAQQQLLAAPAHQVGSVQLLDLSKLVAGAQSTTPAILNCHKGPIVCLSLTTNGLRLATASEKGTLIRVWDTVTKTLIHELGRGADHAEVYCISMNTQGVLCCISDKGTLHLWSGSQHLATAAAPLHTRAQCAVAEHELSAAVICEDGTFHKFTYSLEGGCYRSGFDYFLQLGDEDDDFIGLNISEIKIV